MQITYSKTLGKSDEDLDIAAAINAKLVERNQALADEAGESNPALLTPDDLIAEVIDGVIGNWADQHTQAEFTKRVEQIKSLPRSERMKLDALVVKALP
tara:strand:+ start:2550 stop:2846 length:297 start_codon:yes stop_codon:yes gene_type:complete